MQQNFFAFLFTISGYNNCDNHRFFSIVLMRYIHLSIMSFRRYDWVTFTGQVDGVRYYIFPPGFNVLSLSVSGPDRTEKRTNYSHAIKTDEYFFKRGISMFILHWNGPANVMTLAFSIFSYYLIFFFFWNWLRKSLNQALCLTRFCRNDAESGIECSFVIVFVLMLHVS